MASRVLTVMFTDIKGFTERTSKSSREELDNILGEHEELLVPLLPDFGGRLIKTVGDALLIVFESPTNAVLCGVMMQDRLRDRNRNVPPEQHLEIRVAINTGEVLEREGDVFGDAVNIAARIEGITDASEIYFTEGVYLAMNKAEVPSSEVGVRRLKGIPEPIKIYSVIQDRHSERYTRLIKRLKDGVFPDVKLPSTGDAAPPRKGFGPVGILALAGGGIVIVGLVVLAVVFGFQGSKSAPEPAGTGAVPPDPPPEKKVPDPVLQAAQAVREALEGSDLGLALARADKMLKEHPGRKESHEALEKVVAAEVEALFDKNQPKEALDLIEKRKASQNYVPFTGLVRETLLRSAAFWLKKGRSNNAATAYSRLMKDYPKDVEVLRTVIRDMGDDTRRGYRSMASYAAQRLAELTKGPLEEPAARALLYSLTRYALSHHTAKESRRILVERYPGTAEALRKHLPSDHRITRLNAYTILKDLGALSPEEELAVHFRNLILLRGTGSSESKPLSQSLDALEEASAAPGWAERKKNLPIESIEKIIAWRSRNQLSERVSELLARAFFPEIKPFLLRKTGGDDLVDRHAAFQVLKMAGLDEDFDLWGYHGRNLMLKDYSFLYPCLTAAIEFFKSQAKTPQAPEAKKRLEAAGERIKEHIKAVSKGPFRGRVGIYQRNLEAVEEALKAFE
ncbi:MAG: adenylate/guanylate cyclase domain-containing protein [Planctomycetota bacterium]|jgi:class 3 adenylate cyclase